MHDTINSIALLVEAIIAIIVVPLGCLAAIADTIANGSR